MNSDIKNVQIEIDLLNGDLKKDLFDYDSILKDVEKIKENLNLFRSISKESIKNFDENKDESKIDFGFLNEVYSKIVKDKKEIGEWLVEIQNEEILNSVLKLNDEIQLEIKLYDEFNNLIKEYVNKKEIEEETKQEIEEEKKIEKPKEETKDLDSDDDFDNFLKKPDEYRDQKITNEDEKEIINLDEESKLPWEEDEE